MVFENGVKNIQAAAYNGARTVNKKKHLHKNSALHLWIRAMAVAAKMRCKGDLEHALALTKICASLLKREKSAHSA